MATIQIPPELAKIAAKMSRADLDQVVGGVVAASKPAAAKPPQYGSLIAVSVRSNTTGFAASSSGELVKGAEFGGRRAPKRAYATRARNTGTAYIVRRRTTQQFLPFNPRGYGLVPALRHSMAGIRKRILDAVREAVS